MKDCRLYVIIDKETAKDRDIRKMAEEAFKSGADIIQFRDKFSEDKSLLRQAKAIKRIAKRQKKLFIINDRADIALMADADGVHLGQGDIPIEEARKILGGKIIGISAHNYRQAKIAQEKGADYIGIGPIFKSKTKKGLLPIGPSALSRISRLIDIPFFAIGGISADNIKKVRRAGGKRVAVAYSAIGKKKVCKAVRLLREAMG